MKSHSFNSACFYLKGDSSLGTFAEASVTKALGMTGRSWWGGRNVSFRNSAFSALQSRIH